MRKIFMCFGFLIFLSTFICGQQSKVAAVKAVIPDFQVNENAGPAGAEQYWPAIASSSSGNIVAVWHDYRNGNWDIYAQRYNDNGSTIGENFKVNDDDGNANQLEPAIAVDSTGGFIIVWRDERNGNPEIYAQRYSSDGSPIGQNFIINDDGGSALQYRPAAAIDASGGFIVVWHDDRNGNWDIYAQRYSSDGSLLGQNFMINDDNGSASQYEPAIAAGSSGGFVVVWHDYRDGTWDVYAQRYDADGSTIGPNFKVNDDNGNTRQIAPDIAFDSSKGFVIAWRDERNGDADIYAQRYDDDGLSIGQNFKVNDDTVNARQDKVDVAMDASGSFVITWPDTRNGNWDIYSQRYDDDGSPVGSNFRVNDDAGNDKQFKPKVAYNSSGGFILIWEDKRNVLSDIYAQRYDASGTPLGQNFKVNDDEGSAGQYTPAVAVDDLGSFVIAWYDFRDGDRNIYAQRFGYDGSVLGQNFRVNDDSAAAQQYEPAVAFDSSGGFIIVWHDYRNGNWDVYAQRYNDNGSAIGQNFKVNDDAGSAHQLSTDIISNALNGYIIVWRDERGGNADIYAQRYDNDGSSIGQNFKVNDDAGSAAQYRPSAAFNVSGDFIVVWHDLRDGDRNIYAQRYNSDGSPIGQNFRVNDDASTEQQYEPAVAFDSSGGFIVAWEDYRNGDRDIYAQRYEADGSPIGVNFKVNDDAGGALHRRPSVEADSSDGFIIVWRDDRNGDADIYAQRFSHDGSFLDSNFVVSSSTDRQQVSPDLKLFNGRIYNTWASNHAGGTGYDIWANVLDWNNPTGIAEEMIKNVSNYQLFQNYPNPFNPSTTITYELPKSSHVRLTVYNILGERIRVLLDKRQSSGRHQVLWNGHDEQGRMVSSGIYIYKIDTGDFQQAQKMILFR